MAIEYVFCINTGRSGSDYLTELLAHAENSVSIHEGLPMMNGEPMIAFNNGQPEAMNALMPLKLREMQRQRRRAGTIYCETNHSFIKGWGYLLPDRYIPQQQIAVIVLRRDPQKIAESLLRTHNVPGANAWTRTWWLNPTASNNLSQPPANADALALCRWYVDETERRAADYRRRFPDITYIDCSLEQLNQPAYVQGLFRRLGLIAKADLTEVCGKAINPMNEWPKLPISQLTQPPRFPSADQQPSATLAPLIAAMSQRLLNRHGAEFHALKPLGTHENSLAAAVAGFVARHQPELEAHFKLSLRHTEVETALTWRLLAQLDRYDLLQLFVHPMGNGSPFYRYDFNTPSSLRQLIKRFGLGIFPRLIRLGLQRRSLREDRSHRRATNLEVKTHQTV